MQYERFATAATAAFDTYASQLAAIYFRARLAGAELNPRALFTLQVQAAGLHGRFVSAIQQDITGYLAQMPAGTPAAARSAAYIAAIDRIASAAFTQLMQRIRGVDKKALFSSEPQGGMRDLLRRAQDKIEFRARDSAGRTWSSGKLVAFLSRDFAYQVAIDDASAHLAADGDLAQIRYLDPHHANNGMVVSLSGRPGHPSLASVREAVFHPNATAYLAHVSPQQ